MKFKAIRPLFGDYGPDGTPMKVEAGQVFDVPQYRIADLQELEARGIIERHIPRTRVDRKAITVYQNKAIVPPVNKTSKEQ